MVGRNILEHSSAKKFEILAPSRTELDLLDRAKVNAYLNYFAPDIVIHAAGRVGGIQANLGAPVGFLVDNTRMALNLIESAHVSGVTRLINLASSCMYPRLAENPLKEEMLLTGELEPTNEGYALAKLVATRHCGYITDFDAGAHYKTLIPCNLYGRHDDFDEFSGHMIPAVMSRMVAAVRQRKEVIEAWGDGSARREFMLASDFANFIFFALSNFDQLPTVMNVGVGEDHSVADYYQAIASVVGFRGSIEFDTSKPVGMQRKLLDVSWQKRLGWAPSRSLNDGLGEAFNYLNQRSRFD